MLNRLSNFVFVVIEYLIPSSGKLYHHKMKVLGLKKTSDNDEIIDALREKHSPYFATNKISDEQLSSTFTLKLFV